MWMYISAFIAFLVCFFQFHNASSGNKIQQQYIGNGYHAVATPIITRKPISPKYAIFFDFDSYYLNYNSAITISKIANDIIDNPNIGIEIVTHTDLSGKLEYNQELSENRAQVVQDAFVVLGIPHRLVQYN